jgi:hypothetical protein
MLHVVTAYMDKYKTKIMHHDQPRYALLQTFKRLSFDFPSCHDTKTFLLKKYISTKIHYWAKNIVVKRFDKSSKTVAGVLQR